MNLNYCLTDRNQNEPNSTSAG